MLSIISLFILVFVVSFIMTLAMRRYALSKELLDVPNSRSSHVVSTPSGGGVAIVSSFLLGVFILSISGLVDTALSYALIGACIFVAGIGFIDDHNHVSSVWRLLIHFFAVLWALYWLRGVAPIQIYGFDTSWVVLGVVSILLVWLLNLFNFMDGIDGIACSEAIFVAFGGAVFCWLLGYEGLALVMLVLAVASLGFLLLNWPPARIFMGDVGSGFLGVALGVLAYASIIKGVLFWIWFILFSVFFIDASMTLARRLFRGDRWYEAHCSHAYQRAARRWGHLRVTMAVNLINVFWLLPLAFAAYTFPEHGFIIVVIAVAPLIALAYLLGAGAYNSEDYNE